MLRLVTVFLLLFCMSVSAANDLGGKEKPATVYVGGRIVSASGEAIPGARLIVKGTGRSVYSDFNGNFNISLDTSRDTQIVVDVLGYEVQSIDRSEIRLYKEIVLKAL
jgi:hypothetical protein